MPIHSDKSTEQIVEGAGAPALLLNFTSVVAIGKIQVRKSLAGRYSSMSNFKENHHDAQSE